MPTTQPAPSALQSPRPLPLAPTYGTPRVAAILQAERDLAALATRTGRSLELKNNEHGEWWVLDEDDCDAVGDAQESAEAAVYEATVNL